MYRVTRLTTATPVTKYKAVENWNASDEYKL